jgi:hypothetical protein
LLTSYGAVGLQFEKCYIVGDKVGERKEVMGTQTGGSVLISGSEQAGDQLLNYTQKSIYA